MMAQLKNPMEIFKLLNKSNCRKCGEKPARPLRLVFLKGRKNSASVRNWIKA